MRKIDDEELLKMVEAGVSQKDCANHFQTSASAVCQRLRKLKGYQLPESALALTEKRRRFAIAKAQGKSNMAAAKEAFDCTSDRSAKSMATVLMKDKDINRAIHDILHEHGLSISHRTERLKWLINHRDPSSVYRGLDMANKLTGDYAAEKVDVNVSRSETLELIWWIKQKMNWEEQKAIEARDEGGENLTDPDETEV